MNRYSIKSYLIESLRIGGTEAARRAHRNALITLLIGMLIGFGAGQVRAGTAEYLQGAQDAVGFLSASQNADGSWGASEDVRAVYTAAAVEGLRAFNVRGSAYLSGITWLENHAMSNTDFGARRIVALAPHGDNLNTF
jgi:hypothetical protein